MRPRSPLPAPLPALIAGLTLLVSPASPAEAERLYQWQDPRTGNTQLSGRPPGWYRSDRSTGPRVLVFQRGQLVDDTAVPVSPALRAALRQESLAAAGMTEQADGQRPGPASPSSVAQDAVEDASQVPGVEGTPGPLSPAEDGADGEREKALEVLERFDAARLKAARAMVEALLPEEPAAPVAGAALPAPVGELPTGTPRPAQVAPPGP